MATVTLEKVTGRLRLENGYDDYGNVKYVNQSLGDLSETYFASNPSEAATKLLAIKSTLAPCLSKTIGYLEVIETSEISASA